MRMRLEQPFKEIIAITIKNPKKEAKVRKSFSFLKIVAITPHNGLNIAITTNIIPHEILTIIFRI